MCGGTGIGWIRSYRCHPGQRAGISWPCKRQSCNNVWKCCIWVRHGEPARLL